MNHDRSASFRRWASPWVILAAFGCGGSTAFVASGEGAGGSADGGVTAGSGGSTSGSGGSEVGGSTGTGTGGSSSTGGTNATGGGSGSGGAGGTTIHTDGGLQCHAGMTKFHMTEASGTDYCVGTQCTLSWVSVKAMNGKSMSLSGGCVTTCDVCRPIACAASLACVAPQHMTPEGQSITWDGTYYEPSTCGAGLSCQDKQCAPPGRYIATMCANRSTSDAGMAGFCQAAPTPTCVDVEFDYPTAATVEGVVGAK